MAPTTAILPHALLKMRPLQNWFLAHFRPHVDSPQRRQTPTLTVRRSLRWWAHPLNLMVGRRFISRSLSIQVTTDASNTGWGAHCLHVRAHDLWNSKEQTHHINYLELLAIIKAFKTFKLLLLRQVVQIITDNTTALFYINKQGRTCSNTLLQITLSFWE
ncbi:hypothetical protein JRQ81_009473, partial [Phrynocephalus forsythii]